mmetsp:Transcript_116386/g.248947  ORF Transcript_116386/g.248947 Transcript_116386/m.248947 type:complete len:201 (-) Transcript_116386:144-746(-)
MQRSATARWPVGRAGWQRKCRCGWPGKLSHGPPLPSVTRPRRSRRGRTKARRAAACSWPASSAVLRLLPPPSARSSRSPDLFRRCSTTRRPGHALRPLLGWPPVALWHHDVCNPRRLWSLGRAAATVRRMPRPAAGPGWALAWALDLGAMVAFQAWPFEGRCFPALGPVASATPQMAAPSALPSLSALSRHCPQVRLMGG